VGLFCLGKTLVIVCMMVGRRQTQLAGAQSPQTQAGNPAFRGNRTVAPGPTILVAKRLQDNADTLALRGGGNTAKRTAKMTEHISQPIRARLKAARVAAKMSQADVASHFLMSRQTVSKWEHCGALPTALQLHELGLLYGVSMDYVLYGLKSVPIATTIIGHIFREREPRSDFEPSA
jgi:DNA-binding transcriptional regulator YiaG